MEAFEHGAVIFETYNNFYDLYYNALKKELENLDSDREKFIEKIFINHECIESIDDKKDRV